MPEHKNRRLRPRSKSVCTEHSIPRVAVASGSWNRGKEKVIGDQAVKEWRGGGWTAHRVPAGRQAGAFEKGQGSQCSWSLPMGSKRPAGAGPPDPRRRAVATLRSVPQPPESRDLSQQARLQLAHVFNLDRTVFKKLFLSW